MSWCAASFGLAGPFGSLIRLAAGALQAGPPILLTGPPGCRRVYTRFHNRLPVLRAQDSFLPRRISHRMHKNYELRRQIICSSPRRSPFNIRSDHQETRSQIEKVLECSDNFSSLTFCYGHLIELVNPKDLRLLAVG